MLAAMARDHGRLFAGLRALPRTRVCALAAAVSVFFSAGCDDAPLVPIKAAPDLPLSQCAALGGLVGYGTGTTGGLGGRLVDVSTAEELKAAALMDGPLVIHVAGTISLSEQIRVASNKTIVGLKAGDGLTGGGLFINGVSNVIVQNLSISFALGNDAIGVQASDHVWVDHCELWSDRDHPDNFYDGLVDITHACDDVTVSWTSFHDHKATCLVGHSFMNMAEDTGHLTVTFHHNHFQRVDEGSPRVRFGTVHVFNDLYEDIGSYAIASQMGAIVHIEGSVFRNTPIAWQTHEPDPMDGFIVAADNQTGNARTMSAAPSMDRLPPYVYVADASSATARIVRSCAGVQKITPATPQP